MCRSSHALGLALVRPGRLLKAKPKELQGKQGKQRAQILSGKESSPGSVEPETGVKECGRLQRGYEWRPAMSWTKAGNTSCRGQHGSKGQEGHATAKAMGNTSWEDKGDGGRSPHTVRESHKNEQLGARERLVRGPSGADERGMNSDWKNGRRIGEADTPGPYSVGGASGSAAGNIWHVAEDEGQREKAVRQKLEAQMKEERELEGMEGTPGPKRRREDGEARGKGVGEEEAAGGPRSGLEAKGCEVGQEVEAGGVRGGLDCTHPFDLWEGKHIGSRRRRGSSTPTDSNVTADLEVEDGGYTLLFATANRSEKGPAEEFAFSTKADVIMLQETHVAGDQEASFKQRLKGGGWKAVSAPATPTIGRGTSGGVMIAARSKIGIGLVPGDTTGVVVEGRIVAVHIAAVCKGGVVCYSVYLYPTEGLTDRNLKLLEALAIHARGHGKPWIAGGGWNLDPQSLEGANWPIMLGAVVRATTDPMGTCAKGTVGSNIDFFLVDKRLKWVSEEPEVDISVRPNPHRPLNMSVVGRAHTFVGRYRPIPRSVPLVPIIGPRREPMVDQWQVIERKIQETMDEITGDPRKRGTATLARGFNDILGQFSRLAEQEVAAGHDIFLERHMYLGRPAAKFVKKPVMGWRTRELFQTSTKSGSQWRWTHSHLSEILKMEWAVRGSRKKIVAGGEEGEVAKTKCGRQQRHLASLLIKVGKRGVDMLVSQGDLEEWRMRWIRIADMAVEVASGKELDVVKLSGWAAEARALAERDEEGCRKKNREGWIAWAKKSVKKGGSAAHKWLKGLANWKPEYAGTVDHPEYGPQAIADECLEQWRAIWDGEHWEEPDEGHINRSPGEDEVQIEKLLTMQDWEAEALAPITLEEVKAALRSFKEHTGVGFCGWHPRVLAQLPEEGMKCVWKLLQMAEMGAVWPEVMRNVDMVRIPKESGGHRLIGLLPTLYRLWGKLRRPDCVSWEDENNDGTDYAVSGQSAQRAAWDFALSNEAVKATGGSTVAWQGDLEKCYEYIPFQSIVEEAVAARFPPVITKLALCMYAGSRRIVKDKVYSNAVRTRKGIIAGCSIATTLVKVCLRRIMISVGAKFPRITRRVFLDDISLQWKGRDRGGARVRSSSKGRPPKEFIEAVKYCIELLRDKIGGRVSAKSKFLANSKALLQSCLASFRQLGLEDKGSGADVARYLGVDYSAIKLVSGSQETRRGRQVKAKSKVRRAKMLKKAGADMTGVWMAGPSTSVAFGAQVYGVNGSALERARKICGSVVLPGGGGRSLTRGFRIAKREHMDPICHEGIAPIHAWGMEAWLRKGDLTQMKVAWRYARDSLKGARRPWSRVRGPASAAWASLERIGWKFTSPFTMKSDRGIIYDVREVSPKRLLRRLKEAGTRWGWRRVFEGKGYGRDEAEAMAARVQPSWHRHVLYGKHDTPAEERGAVRAILDQSAWTEARCCEAGYLQFPICTWCQSTVGNMKHRLYGCPRLAVVEGKKLSEDLKDRGKAAKEDDPFWTELVPLSCETPQGGESHFEWIGDQVVFTGKVYGDGSARGPDFLRRGGSAVGMLKTECEEELWSLGEQGLEGGWCTLGGEDHTSAEAELNALLQVVMRAIPPVHYVTDSMLLVRGVGRGRAWTTRVNQIQADWWSAIWKCVEDWPKGTLSASHVKAHRKKEVLQGLDREGRLEWHGNRLTDSWAGVAAESNQVAQEVKDLVCKQKREYVSLARWAGVVNKECAMQKPWGQEGKRWRVHSEARGGERRRLPRHSLVQGPLGIRCERCACVAKTRLSMRRLRALPCFGSLLHKATNFARTRNGGFKEGGHLLQVSRREKGSGGGQIVWCVRCGAYGEKVARGLLKRCKGTATRTGKWVIKKFEKNRHPIDGGRLKRAVAYLPNEEGQENTGEGGTRVTGGGERSGPGEPSTGRQEATERRLGGESYGAWPTETAREELQIIGGEREVHPPGDTSGEGGTTAPVQGPSDWLIEQEREAMFGPERLGVAFEEPPDEATSVVTSEKDTGNSSREGRGGVQEAAPCLGPEEWEIEQEREAMAGNGNVAFEEPPTEVVGTSEGGAGRETAGRFLEGSEKERKRRKGQEIDKVNTKRSRFRFD